MKHVDETKAGKSIAAWIVIAPDNKLVARIQAHFSDSGRVTVNLWNWGHDESEPCYQEGSAGGYGYDKLTAALNHMIVDGLELTNHCAVRLDPPTEQGFPNNYETPKGYHLANWRDGFYSDCYKQAGLDYLRDCGYSVIQAI